MKSALVISPTELEMVLEILGRHVPEREVVCFGSRAGGAAKPFSDLDLCVMGETPLAPGLLAALKDDFSESDLPYKVDVVDWADTSATFRKIITEGALLISPNKTG